MPIEKQVYLNIMEKVLIMSASTYVDVKIISKDLMDLELKIGFILEMISIIIDWEKNATLYGDIKGHFNNTVYMRSSVIVTENNLVEVFLDDII